MTNCWNSGFRLMPGRIWKHIRNTGNGECAAALVREGFENGHFDQLETIWEKTFYQLPLGHCEGTGHLDRADEAIEIGKKLLADAPQHLNPLYEFNAQQPVEGRKVIAAFGRLPHRNAVLGGISTPAELAYPKIGKYPHQGEIEI